MHVTAILLAAGRAKRFGSAKLLVPLASSRHIGQPVAVAAYRNLREAIGDVIVVLRPDDPALAALFDAEAAWVIVADRAGDGMGASLAAGVAAAPGGCGYLVALADMPWIEPATIERIADAIVSGASVVVPAYRGRRGHPVGFAAKHREALLASSGDHGARDIVDAHRDALSIIDADDPGIVRDIDTPEDLR